MFELVSLENQEFEGNNLDDQFLYSGSENITGETVQNDDGSQELVEKEYLFSTRSKRRISQAINKCILDSQKNLSAIAVRNYTLVNDIYDRDRLNEKRDTFYKDSVRFQKG